MNARKCDRCGEFYEEYATEYGSKESDTVLFVNTCSSITYITQKEFNLCKKCMSELKKWMGEEK